jgi:hypothetical protein
MLVEKTVTYVLFSKLICISSAVTLMSEDLFGNAK